MSNLSHALQTAIADLEWTQSKVAADAKIPFPQVSRYFRGHAMPAADAFEKLCSALPPIQQAQVICAYLEDMVPDSGRELVKISAAVRKGRDTSRLPAHLTREVQAALQSLAKQAVQHPEIGKFLVQLDSLLKRE